MKEKQPMVSMITYCYNGARFVHRYFEAILAQTYQNIELIFFNNGSEDDTGEIAEAYKARLEARGIAVQLIHYKENQCTCELKQKGFRLSHGEYIFGCDSDDVIHPTYMEEMSGFLQAHPEKGIVFCQLNNIQEETGELLGVSKIIPKETPGAAFQDMLNARNTIFTAISYMMSRKYLEQVIPNMEFYVSKYGENYQIQLPFLYHDLQGYIEKPLGDYYIRRDSYTGKMKKDPAMQINAFKGQENSILATLESIQPKNLDDYKTVVLRRLRKDSFYSSLYLKDKKIRKDCYRELKEVGGMTAKERLVYFGRPIYLLLKR